MRQEFPGFVPRPLTPVYSLGVVGRRVCGLSPIFPSGGVPVPLLEAALVPQLPLTQLFPSCDLLLPVFLPTESELGTRVGTGWNRGYRL